MIEFEIVVVILSFFSIIYCLFGVILGSVEFCYYICNLFYFDLLVVDEVFMVDLFLMVKLVEVLFKYVWLILFGDKD